MRKFLFTSIFFFLCLANCAFGYEIAVVKSSLSKINSQVENIFFDELARNLPRRGLKSISPHKITEILITTDNYGKRSGALKLSNMQPDLILALGPKALRVALSVPDIPIVHLLVINAEEISGDARHVAGVSMAVPPKVQLDEMTRHLPQVKKIGLIYDPHQSLPFIPQLHSLRPDLEFIRLATDNSADVPGLINSLHGRVDLLWMLPDRTATNSTTIESYVLYSIRNKTPLLTFSAKLLKVGATIAVTFDTDAMATQAAELAVAILTGNDNHLPRIIAPQAKTIVNQKMATKLNIVFAKEEKSDD